MTVTEAKHLRKGRTRLTFDEGEAAEVSTKLWSESRFKVGGEISEEELRELIDFSERFLAREKALWLLSGRDYAKRELFEKLRSEFEEQAAMEVCDALEETGILSDETYAMHRAQSLITRKGYSPRRAAWELQKKGISRALAQEAAEAVECEPEEEAANLIRKKYPDALNDDAVFRRAAAFLGRYGYSPREIRTAFEILSNRQE